MTDALDTQIATLRSRLAAAQRARGRAEHERDAALTAAQTARAQLAEEFGVHGIAQARARLAELEAQLRGYIDELRTALEQIGV